MTKKESNMSLSFNISHADLRKAAMTMGRVIERWNRIPILGYCKIEVSPGQVTFSGTDQDNEVSFTVEADTSDSGTTMLEAKVLKALVASMTGEIAFEVDDQAPGHGIIRITDGDAKMELSDIMPATDYPVLHSKWIGKKPKAGVTMSQADLHRMISLSRHCISDEGTRYYLNGLHLTQKPDGDTLRAVSTDGRRMAVIDTDYKVDEGASCIVPVKVVDLIKSLISKDGNESVTFCLQENFMQFYRDGVLMTAKLINGTFPDHTRVIPKPSDAITANLGLEGLRRASAFASVTGWFGSKALKIDAAAGEMKVSSKNGSLTLPCQAKSQKGADTEIGFNHRFLLEQARVTPSFRLSAAGAGDPATIHSDDPNAFWVLMPLRV